jgi:hypothetical protein
MHCVLGSKGNCKCDAREIMVLICKQPHAWVVRRYEYCSHKFNVYTDIYISKYQGECLLTCADVKVRWEGARATTTSGASGSGKNVVGLENAAEVDASMMTMTKQS